MTSGKMQFSNKALEDCAKRATERAEWAEEQITALRKALAFYADPLTYFAIAFIPDRPAGDFMEDFEDTDAQNIWEPIGVKPGKRARQALAVTKPETCTCHRQGRWRVHSDACPIHGTKGKADDN